MSRYITLQQLIDAGACEWSCRLFQAKFGKRVRVTQKLCRTVAQYFSWDGAAVRLLSNAALAEYRRLIAPERQRYLIPDLYVAYREVAAPVFAKLYNEDTQR